MKKVLITTCFLSFVTVSAAFSAAGYPGCSGSYSGAKGYSNGGGYIGGGGYNSTSGYKNNSGYIGSGSYSDAKDYGLQNVNQQQLGQEKQQDLQNNLDQSQIEQLTKEGQLWLQNHPEEAKQIQHCIEQQNQQ